MRGWRAAPEGSCLGYDREPRCEPVVAYAVEGEDTWVLTEQGQILRVLREYNDRLLMGGEV